MRMLQAFLAALLAAPALASYDKICTYEPDTNVVERSEIDLDVKRMNDASSNSTANEYVVCNNAAATLYFKCQTNLNSSNIVQKHTTLMKCTRPMQLAATP